jgi:hypothetical protein
VKFYVQVNLGEKDVAKLTITDAGGKKVRESECRPPKPGAGLSATLTAPATAPSPTAEGGMQNYADCTRNEQNHGMILRNLPPDPSPYNNLVTDPNTKKPHVSAAVGVKIPFSTGVQNKGVEFDKPNYSLKVGPPGSASSTECLVDAVRRGAGKFQPN